MGAWSRDKVDSSEINSGNEYTINDNLSLENLNAMVNSGLYSQDVVERMGNVGDYSASTTYLFPNIVRYATDGCGYMAIYKSGSDYASFSGVAPTNATYWKKIVDKGDQGIQGIQGVSVSSIAKTSTDVLTDTYTITFSDDTITTFDVENGKGISNIAKTSTTGLVDTYTITYNDTTTSTFNITNGNGISTIEKTDTVDNVDTYTITFTNGTTTTFEIINSMTAEEKEKVSKIIINGDGKKALLNDGTYGEVGTIDTVSINGGEPILPDENKNIDITITADEIDDTNTTNKWTNLTEKSYWNDKVDKVYSTDYAYTDGLNITWNTDHYRVGDGTTTNGNGYTGTATEMIIPKFFDDGTHGIAPIVEIGNYAFREKTTIISVKIPDSVTSIGIYAFQDCISLTSIKIPNSVTSIGSSVFRNCSSLTSVTIPNSVTSIGTNAFQYCSNLTSITIPNSVTSIGFSAFYYCDNLTSITIPNSVTSIGNDAFYSCTSLTSIIILGITPPTFGFRVFNDTNNCPIYVPSASLTAYKTATNWSNYADRIFAIPDGKWITEDLAQIATNTGDITNLQNNKADKATTYNKTEIDSKIASVYKYKGSVANYASLPTDNLTIGDVYNVEDTGDNYAWTGSEWDKLAGTVDLSNYATNGQAFNKVYKSLSDLTGIDASSTLAQLCDAMTDNSYLNISTSGYANLVPTGETDLNGQLEIIKVNGNRVRLAWSYQNASRQPIYMGTYRNVGGFLGWKRLITDSEDQTISGIKTFNAPTNIALTEQTTAKFMTSNGGSLTIGKEGQNSGTMLRFDQVDGTKRLLFRASATAGAMVWNQPENNSLLLMDLVDNSGTSKRITFGATRIHHPVKIASPIIETTTLTNGTNNFTLPSSSGTLATTQSYTATLSASGWTGSSAPYSKEVTVSGILATDKLNFDLDLDSATYANIPTIQSAWFNIYRTVQTANTITFYSHEIPSIDIPLLIKVVR